MQSQIANRKSQILAWQGLSLTIPETWNPVKVDGDHAKGSLLLADMHSAKLGIRWRRLSKREEPDSLLKRLMRDEVGALAAEEAKPDSTDALLYLEPAPPGRDVWIGYSRASDRVVQIVHHASSSDRRDFIDAIQSFGETEKEASHHWAIFDIDWVTPPGYSLRWYRLNAGDHTLAFADPSGKLSILRQIRPATLALSRQPLDGWLTLQQQAAKKLYQPIAETSPFSMNIDGQMLEGLTATMHRRRRFFWSWLTPAVQTLIGLHDETANRLLIAQCPSALQLEQLLTGVGWRRRSATLPAASAEFIV